MADTEKVRERKKNKKKNVKTSEDSPQGEDNNSSAIQQMNLDKDDPSTSNENSGSPSVTDAGQSGRKRGKGKDKAKGQKESGSWLFSSCGKIKYIFLVIFVPPFLNYASLQREAVELKPAGELYDIGWGQKLFLSCHGQGEPTVVLDAPTGMNSDVWVAVAARLSKLGRVCVYDRAGIGFSERPVNRSGVSLQADGQTRDSDKWQPFTVERMVDDLNKLISSSSQQPRPLILVGAELGAVVAQFYAHIYESEVLGLVLVNPLPEGIFEQADGAWSHHWFNSVCPTYQTLQLGAALGVTRIGLLAGALKQPITGEYVTDEVVLRQKYLMCHPRHLSSVVDEHHFINETLSQLRTLHLIKPLARNISVSVLTGNYYDEQMPAHLNKAWARAEQKLLSRFSARAKHLVVNGADRHMMYRKPDAIIETVTKLIRQWRKKQALKGSQSS